MRPIDADNLLKKVDIYFDGLPIVVHHDMVEFIKNAPTADVAEVVRCKDCCHNESSLSEPWCRIYECRKSNNGFCDEGKRKETEDAEIL